MRIFNKFRSIRSWLGVAALALASTGAFAGTPGCVGKMWNPLGDLDFRLMGGIKVVGIKIMDNPKALGEPPNHKAPPMCACKDGLKSGFGLGLTFWMPSYINDVARQAGCLGFLNGINVLPGFVSLSSGQQYSSHQPSKEGTTNMQIHWAYADVAAIAGKSLFEKCNAVTGAMTIAYMTEPDFIFQSDVYSVIMTPQAAILAASPLLAQIACGAESVANTLGGWQDWGVCAWNGSRLPLSTSSISKNSAQVSNMDVTVKYLTRSALLGTTLRTMGEDATCRPFYSPFYDPFQHRYQWSFPGKVSTRYNVDMIRWGMFIKDDGQGNLIQLSSDTAEMAGLSSTSVTVGSEYNDSAMGPPRPGEVRSTKSPSAANLGLAERIVKALPKPLNYPTKEAGYMQVWEARQCCLMVVTFENIIKMIIKNFATMGTGWIADAYEVYNVASTVYSVVTDPIGAALSFVGDVIADGIGEIADSIGLNDSMAAITNGIKDSLSGV